MTTQICHILNGRFLAQWLLCRLLKFPALSGSDWPDHMRPWPALLLSPRRWLRRVESAPSPSRIHSYLRALSSAAGKENPPLPDPRSALVSPAHCTGASAVHDHPTVPRTHRRALVWRHAHHAFTRRLLCEHPLPSSLPSSLSLIQQLPAGLIHTESPEYCWPEGGFASLKLGVNWKNNGHTICITMAAQSYIFSLCMPNE